MAMNLKRTAVSTYAALTLVLFSLSTSSAFAQGPSSNGASGNGAHSKASGIPEKKSDGTWENLKPAQQKILEPLESDWDYMLPESRKKWIQIANLYPKMSGQDQARLQSRMKSWSNLSQRDRRHARENYLVSLKFPADKKAEAWSAYQKLSDEEKKKLAKAEESKKKPTAASAPTLQQHLITQKPLVRPSAPESTTESTVESATESTAESKASPSTTSNQ